MIGTASRLILKELEALGIHIRDLSSSVPADITDQQLSNRPLLPLPMDSSSLSVPPNMLDNGPVNQYDDAVLLDLSYFNSQVDDSMSYNLLDMPPEMYEAFSQIEPISVIMNPGFDIY